MLIVIQVPVFNFPRITCLSEIYSFFISLTSIASSNSTFCWLNATCILFSNKAFSSSSGSNSKNIPKVEVKFKGMFPISLSSLDYTQESTDVEYFKASASFRYLYYEFESSSW